MSLSRANSSALLWSCLPASTFFAKTNSVLITFCRVGNYGPAVSSLFLLLLSRLLFSDYFSFCSVFPFLVPPSTRRRRRSLNDIKKIISSTSTTMATSHRWAARHPTHTTHLPQTPTPLASYNNSNSNIQPWKLSSLEPHLGWESPFRILNPVVKPQESGGHALILKLNDITYRYVVWNLLTTSYHIRLEKNPLRPRHVFWALFKIVWSCSEK